LTERSLTRTSSRASWRASLEKYARDTSSAFASSGKPGVDEDVIEDSRYRKMLPFGKCNLSFHLAVRGERTLGSHNGRKVTAVGTADSRAPKFLDNMRDCTAFGIGSEYRREFRAATKRDVIDKRNRASKQNRSNEASRIGFVECYRVLIHHYGLSVFLSLIIIQRLLQAVTNVTLSDTCGSLGKS